MMTDSPIRPFDVKPPGEQPRLVSPLDGLDLNQLQRELTDRFGYEVDIDLYVQIVTDPEQWDLPRFKAAMVGPDPDDPVVKSQTIDVWRMNTRKLGGASSVSLPKEQGKHGQSPWWYAGTLMAHVIEHGWARPDGTPCRPMPPGKPLHQRDA